MSTIDYLVQNPPLPDNLVMKTKIDTFLTESYVPALPVLVALLNLVSKVKPDSKEKLSAMMSKWNDNQPAADSIMELLQIADCSEYDDKDGENTGEIMLSFREIFIEYFKKSGNEIDGDLHEYMWYAMLNLEERSEAFNQRKR
jgi:hypothetical protein